MAAEIAIPLNEKLLRHGRMPDGESGGKGVPLSEIPMLLTLDQLRPNPDNPRTSRNPKYDEIKASIRSRGLDSVPKVTRDPECPDDTYIFSDGGNTRHAILSELYAETGDDRFRCIPCIVKPWPGRLHCVIGHLAENDMRGELSFIEKAFGIEKARIIHEEQLGRTVSQRELAELLKSSGYPVHHSNISRMKSAVELLYPWMPDLLNSGIGRPQVSQLLALRSTAEKVWQSFREICAIPPERDFSSVFGEVSRDFNNPEDYSADLFKAALITAMQQAMPDPALTGDTWLAAFEPQELQQLRLPEAKALLQPPVTAEKKPAEKLPEKVIRNRQKNAGDKIPDTPPPVSVAPDTVTDIWHIPALQDDIEHLQNAAFRLAYELAAVTGEEHTIHEDLSPESPGYRVSPVGNHSLPAALCGSGNDCIVSVLIGEAHACVVPVCDDETVLKYFRLIRIVRRIRELQRERAGVCV